MKRRVPGVPERGCYETPRRQFFHLAAAAATPPTVGLLVRADKVID